MSGGIQTSASQVVHKIPKFIRFVAKWILGVAVAIPLAAVLGFFTYDLISFQPHRQKINLLIAAATDEERNPPDNVVRLLQIAYAGGLYWPVARELITELHISPREKGMLHWHVTGILWSGLVALHLSEQEKIALFVSQAYMGDGLFGFSAASKAMFGAPLTTLPDDKLATLVALSTVPSEYLQSPERLAKRGDWLLQAADDPGQFNALKLRLSH